METRNLKCDEKTSNQNLGDIVSRCKELNFKLLSSKVTKNKNNDHDSKDSNIMKKTHDINSEVLKFIELCNIKISSGRNIKIDDVVKLYLKLNEHFIPKETLKDDEVSVEFYNPCGVYSVLEKTLKDNTLIPLDCFLMEILKYQFSLEFIKYSHMIHKELSLDVLDEIYNGRENYAMGIMDVMKFLAIASTEEDDENDRGIFLSDVIEKMYLSESASFTYDELFAIFSSSISDKNKRQEYCIDPEDISERFKDCKSFREILSITFNSKIETEIETTKVLLYDASDLIDNLRFYQQSFINANSAADNKPSHIKMNIENFKNKDDMKLYEPDHYQNFYNFIEDFSNKQIVAYESVNELKVFIKNIIMSMIELMSNYSYDHFKIHDMITHILFFSGYSFSNNRIFNKYFMKSTCFLLNEENEKEEIRQNIRNSLVSVISIICKLSLISTGIIPGYLPEEIETNNRIYEDIYFISLCCNFVQHCFKMDFIHFQNEISTKFLSQLKNVNYLNVNVEDIFSEDIDKYMNNIHNEIFINKDSLYTLNRIYPSVLNIHEFEEQDDMLEILKDHHVDFFETNIKDETIPVLIRMLTIDDMFYYMTKNIFTLKEKTDNQFNELLKNILFVIQEKFSCNSPSRNKFCSIMEIMLDNIFNDFSENTLGEFHQFLEFGNFNVFVEKYKDKISQTENDDFYLGLAYISEIDLLEDDFLEKERLILDGKISDSVLLQIKDMFDILIKNIHDYIPLNYGCRYIILRNIINDMYILENVENEFDVISQISYSDFIEKNKDDEGNISCESLVQYVLENKVFYSDNLNIVSNMLEESYIPDDVENREIFIKIIDLLKMYIDSNESFTDLMFLNKLIEYCKQLDESSLLSKIEDTLKITKKYKKFDKLSSVLEKTFVKKI